MNEAMNLVERLTSRESDVLACIDRGMRNREAACLLGVSENTVKFHLRNIYGKLGVDSRLDAVRIHRGWEISTR